MQMSVTHTALSLQVSCTDDKNTLMAYFFILKQPYVVNDRTVGSQRQRGMYMNSGSSDGGIDPDWDPVEKKWKGKRFSSKSD